MAKILMQCSRHDRWHSACWAALKYLCMVQRNVIAKECGLNNEQLGSQGILKTRRREDSSSRVSSERYLWGHNRICDVLHQTIVWHTVGHYQIW